MTFSPDDDADMDSDSCSVSYAFTQAFADADAATAQQTAFEGQMQHLWSIATVPADETAKTAENTNYAISPLMTPGSNDKSGALGYGIALAASVSVALAF